MVDDRASGNTLPQLGALELRILELLWKSPDQSAKTLHQRLSAHRHLTLSTVQTTLERLHRKQILQRVKQGRSFHYRPVVKRYQLLGRFLGGVINQLHTGDLDPILSSFVEFADKIDIKSLDRLDELIQSRKRLRQSGDSDD